MVIVVVPYEEIGNVLVIAGAPSSIVAAPTWNAAVPLAAVVPSTVAVAVTIPAPAALKLAALMLTVAIPLLSVNAVPVEGTNLARVESAEKVTSLLLATAPVVSVTRAWTVTEPVDGRIVVALPFDRMLNVTAALAVVVPPDPPDVEQPVLNGRQVVEVEVDPP
ncbi:MAG TPA: hypothetical protein PLC55_12640, partial [Zoogloea sp.]|nr:hypothetical protein [Zoogloea sp.]